MSKFKDFLQNEAGTIGGNPTLTAGDQWSLPNSTTISQPQNFGDLAHKSAMKQNPQINLYQKIGGLVQQIASEPTMWGPTVKVIGTPKTGGQITNLKASTFETITAARAHFKFLPTEFNTAQQNGIFQVNKMTDALTINLGALYQAMSSVLKGHQGVNQMAQLADKSINKALTPANGAPQLQRAQYTP